MSVFRRTLTPLPGFQTREVASFVTQMDDQTRRLTEDSRGATSAELEWQPARGMNTIGMLLAHIAIVEVFWIHVAVSDSREVDSGPVLGIGTDDDGMPMPEDGAPPAVLSGKPLAFFDDLLARARAYTKEKTVGFTEADLDREITITWKNGETRVFTPRWILDHVLEHEAGHYGQINLLRHQYKVMAGAPAKIG